MTAFTDLELPIQLYPSLAEVEPTLLSLVKLVQPIKIPAGSFIFLENSPCQGFPLVLEGEVKVSRSSSDGRSLELYRVVPGELCLVSSASLFHMRPMSAQGSTTRDSTVLLIPPDVFREWMDTPAFRDMVMGLFAERLADLTDLVDAIAFQKLDRRLASALLGRGQNLSLSHQALADELGTVREIVTRLLRRFERDGWIELGREHIHILNSRALRAMSNAHLE